MGGKSIVRVYIKAENSVKLKQWLDKVNLSTLRACGLVTASNSYNISEYSSENTLFGVDSLRDAEKLFDYVNPLYDSNLIVLMDYTYYVEATNEPGSSVIYFFGDSVKSKTFDKYDNDHREIWKNVDISNPVSWLNYNLITLWDNEVDVANYYGFKGFYGRNKQQNREKLKQDIKSMPEFIPAVLCIVGIWFFITSNYLFSILLLFAAIITSSIYKKRKKKKLYPIAAMVLSVFFILIMLLMFMVDSLVGTLM